MNRAHVAGFSLGAFHTLLCGALLALLALAAQTPLAIAQDSGTAAPPAQAAPAEPGWLGTQMQELDAASIKALGLDQPHALLAVVLAPDGPAEKSGIRTADIVVALNGQPAPSVDGLIQQIKQAGKGGVLQLDIWRRGERTAISALLVSVRRDIESIESVVIQ